MDFPGGLKVIRSYQELSFEFKPVKVEQYFFEVNEPGMINLPNGTTVKVEYTGLDIADIPVNMAVFDTKRVTFPIIIRTRKKGDRMTLKGMTGSKKLKDIFIDQKIPLHDRDTWPVITDRKGSILWLPGLKKSSFEGIEMSAKQYILLTYIK